MLSWTRRRQVNRWNGFALNAWSLDLRPRSLASFASPRIPLCTARSLQPVWWWTGWRTLRFDEEGTHHWEAPGISEAEKEEASIDLGQLAQAPSPCLDPEETSFSDQVPQSVRITLRQQVVTETPDPELVEALADFLPLSTPCFDLPVFSVSHSNSLSLLKHSLSFSQYFTSPLLAKKASWGFSMSQWSSSP